jgi:hypothetical protein
LILEEAGRHDRSVVDENIGIEAVALERLLDAGAALRRAEIGGEHLDLDRIG